MSELDQNTKEYYDINCIECGNVFKANELTFNIDELLKKHSEDIKKEKNNNTDYDVFRSIKLGMNYTEKEVNVLLEKGSIDVSDIRAFLSSKYGIDIKVQEKELELVGEIAQPRSRRRLDSIVSSSGVPNDVLEKYKKSIKFRARDVDEDTKQVCYEQLHRILTKDETILEIKNFKILYKKDDRGNSFPDVIKYSLPNGKMFMIDELSCPHCGALIKGTLGEHKQFVIGMIGSARVGKTAYLASLVDRIDPEPGIESIDRNIFVKIGESGIGKSIFIDKILSAYRKNEPIPKTPPVNGWVPVFCLEVSINGTYYIFTFVDMPGEVFCRGEDESDYAYLDEDFIMNTQRIITNSHMLWFCIDPIQIDPIIQKTQEQLGTIKKADKVVENLDKLFDAVGKKLKFIQIASENNEKKEAAILITKSDTIGEEFHLLERRGEDERITNRVDNISYFNFERHKEHSQKVRDYLNEKRHILIPSFEEMFKDFNLFAVASYGMDLNTETPGRKPSNVEHPFLWTCAVLGILPCEGKKIITTEIVKSGGIFSRKKEEIQKVQKVDVKREELFFHEK